MLRASIVNRASYAQPYPFLRLALQDRFGGTLGMRDIGPADYLPGAGGTGLLEPGQRADALIRIVDPGAEAVGFELDVCLPAQGGVRCANAAQDRAAMKIGPYELAAPSRARADGGRDGPAVSQALPEHGRGHRGVRDGHVRRASLEHAQVAPSSRPSRRARAAHRADRRLRSRHDVRGGAHERRARRPGHRHQLRLPRQESLQPCRGLRAHARRNAGRPDSRRRRRGRGRAGHAQDAHRLGPGEPQCRRDRPHRRERRRRRSRRARPHARRFFCGRGRIRNGRGRQAGRAPAGFREWRHRLCGQGLEGAGSKRRRRRDDRSRRAGTALDLPGNPRGTRRKNLPRRLRSKRSVLSCFRTSRPFTRSTAR